MELRTKLLLPTLSISLLLLVFIILIAVPRFNNLKIQNKAKQNLTMASAKLITENAIDSISNNVKVIKSSQNLNNAMELDNQLEALDIIQPFYNQQTIDFINLYDNQLNLFANAANPGDFGHHDALYFQLKELLNNKKSTYLVLPYQNQLAIAYASLLNSLNGTSGVLIVGRFIDDKFLNVDQDELSFSMQVEHNGAIWKSDKKS